ncbi:MAG TPA: hypothetical protein VF813_09275, partial [Anaerolineaceae bacterium]
SLVKAGWYELALSPAVLLSPSTPYKLILSRSGGQDAANYYRVELDTTQGGDPASFWNGAWQPFNPPASLIFKVAGEEDTISQVACMLAAGSGGQFLSAQDMPAPSGTLVPMWREGQLTAREEIEALLQLGTGNTRYLAAVDINRRLSISPQPAAGAGDYGLLKSGGLLDPYGSPLPPGACAAGVWARAADAGQALLVGPQMADPARIFIEAMEWDNLRERWRITRG